MATSPTPSESDRVAALAVYDLGAAVGRFRHYAEVKYARGNDRDDFNSPPPAIIGESFRDVVANANNVADALPDVRAAADALIAAAQTCRDCFRRVWLKDDHLSRWEDAALLGLTRSHSIDWKVLSGSPLDPLAWAEYETAADHIQTKLPGASRSILRLSRLLAGVGHPLPSDYDPELDRIPALDDDHVVRDIGPRITALLREIRTASGLLEGVDGRLEGRDPRASVIRLDENVRRALAAARGRDSGEEHPQADESSHTPPALQPPTASADPKSVIATVADNESEEPIAVLLALKKEMDPNDTYIGWSRAVLRLFREMELLNRLPDDPVVILGPTGVGKTHLARLLHDTSERKEGPFLDLSADDLVGGDETIRRVQWAGYGPNSGLAGVSPKEGTEGWLQKTRGGTIFIDEFHSLDERSLNYLRKPLDRDREIPLAVGDGPSFKPNVRFIFATLQTIKDLREGGKIPPDVFRRLRGRFLTVPPLRERKDDIPLFVEKFRGNCRPGECFYLALLYHDWEQGQVDELITAIRTAVANRNNQGTLRASDLRPPFPNAVVARVTGMTEAAVGRELYLSLARILEAQGFLPGDRRGVALQKRLAELLGISDARVSTRLKELELKLSARTSGG